MAEDPINQEEFMEDVAAAAGDGSEPYSNLGDPNGNMKLPSVEEVWKLIQQMEGLSDAERENIRENLYNPQDGSPDDFLKRYASAHPAIAHTKWDYMIFFAMIAIIILVFALFGYKLYKSLMEKELKKQAKQKNKQTKKSKKAN